MAAEPHLHQHLREGTCTLFLAICRSFTVTGSAHAPGALSLCMFTTYLSIPKRSTLVIFHGFNMHLVTLHGVHLHFFHSFINTVNQNQCLHQGLQKAVEKNSRLIESQML